MTESASTNSIDQQQNRIESIKTPGKLKQRLEQNRNILFNAVDNAQDDLASSADNLESAEAKTYMTDSASSIGEYLKQVADHGYAVMQKHNDNKDLEVGESDLSRVNVLSVQLSRKLFDLKVGIESFRKLESEKIVELIVQNDDLLDQNGGGNDISELMKNKEDANKQLIVLESSLPDNPLTASIKSALEQTIKTRTDKINNDITGLKRAETFKSGVDKISDQLPELDKAVAEYEKNPTDQNLSIARGILTTIDFGKLEEDLTMRNESEGLVKNVFNNLWEKLYRPTKEKVEEFSKRVDTKENESLSKQAVVVLETVKKNWDSGIKTQWEKYENSDYETKHENNDLEDNLLRALLATKGLLARFAAPEMNGKIEFSLYQQLSEKYEEMDGNIAKIEGFRASYVNDVDMSKSGIRKYVRFGVREGEGVINDQFYDFTPEFYKLPQEEQTRVQLLAEEIASKNLNYVRNETAKIALESAGPDERIKILREMLGQKGKPYFEGLEKLKSDDLDGAVQSFNSYLAQTFTEEEMKFHQEIIADAKDKVKGVMGEKLLVLDQLFQDVKELAYARSKMGGDPELKVDEGNEADAITAELEVFKQDIADGNVSDFEKRFAEFKEKIKKAVAGKQKKETDLLQLLDRLHQVSNEKDPVKRKAGFADFAQLARNNQAYKLAMKYLDHALEDDLAEASKHVSKSDVLKKMMSEPEFVSNLNEQAQQQLALMLKENPSLRGQLTLERVKQTLLERALDDRYKRELRRYITPEGNLLTDPALAKYNNWFPIDEAAWYKPWDYGAEEWDDFQMECIKFVWESLPSLGIGLAASAAGRVGARVGGRLLMRYLAKQGLTRAEMMLVEQGGIAALKASFMSGRQLTFAASRLAGAVVAETSVMYTMGLGMEYLQTGELAAFKKSPGRAIATGLAQSMLQATMFRVMGLGLSAGPLHREMQKGLLRGGAAWLASESLSGVGGAGIEYAFAKMNGQEYRGQDAFKSLMNNYFMTVGMHFGQGAPRASRADKAMSDVMNTRESAKTRPGEKVEDSSERKTSAPDEADIDTQINPPDVSSGKGPDKALLDQYQNARAGGHEAFEKWKNRLTDPDAIRHVVEMQSRQEALMRGRIIGRILEQTGYRQLSEVSSNVKKVDDALRILNSSAAKPSEVGWLTLASLPGENGVLMMSPEGKVYRFADEVSHLDLGKMSVEFGASMGRYEDYSPFDRAEMLHRRITQEIDVRNVPDEARQKIINDFSPDIMNLLDHPDRTVFQNLSQQQYAQLRLAIHTIKNGEFRSQQIDAGKKASQMVSVVGKLETVLRNEMVKNKSLTREEMHRLLDIENNADVKNANPGAEDLAKLRYIADKMYDSLGAEKPVNYSNLGAMTGLRLRNHSSDDFDSITTVVAHPKIEFADTDIDNSPPSGRKTPSTNGTGAATPIDRGLVHPQKPATSEVRSEPKATKSPETPRAITETERRTAVESLQRRFVERPELEAMIKKIMNKRNLDPDVFNNLDPAEIRLLAESDPEFLNARIVEKILRQKYGTIEDIVNGQPVSIRYYSDNCRQLGQGGLGRVREAYFVVWERNGVHAPETTLRFGAVKETRQRVAEHIKNHPITIHELETLREIRDSGRDAYDMGLVNPLFVGRRAIKDASGKIIRYENVTITEKIDKYDVADSPDLYSAMKAFPPEDSISLLSRALRGVRSMNEMGRLNWDIKLENFFVGTVNDKPVAVVGDLAGIPFAELRNITISEDMYRGKRYVRALFSDSGMGIPTTPLHFRDAYKHIRCQQEWLRTNPGATSGPDYIVSLSDKALVGKSIQEMRKYYMENPDLLPPDVRTDVGMALRDIIVAIKDVPDIDRLNMDILAASAKKDFAAMENAVNAKEEAMERLKNHITMDEIQNRLAEIVEKIENARAHETIDID